MVNPLVGIYSKYVYMYVAVYLKSVHMIVATPYSIFDYTANYFARFPFIAITFRALNVILL